MTDLPETRTGGLGRISAIDMARGGALIAMAIYHFAWDLQFFGYLAPGTVDVGGWKLFARCIASSFLFLVGVSLWLAHRNGVRWPSFWKRWAMVAAAALAISIATWFATPQSFIYFGILHQIALASLLGLLFLRLPAALILIAAAIIIGLPQIFRSDIFDPRYLAWLGFAATPPASNDFVPVFPWFGAVLIGLGVAKLAEGLGWLQTIQRAVASSGGPLGWLGRHSLAFYLIHQPALIGLVWTAAQFVPPHIEPPEVAFRNQCEAACAESREAEFCVRYCDCVLDGLKKGGDITEELRSMCVMNSEDNALGQEGEVQ